MSLARTSASELKAVEKILQDPLTGLHVMIPFTGKAFFEGTLQPTMIQEHQGARQEEGVVVKLSKDTLVEMSRSEALTLLQSMITSDSKTNMAQVPHQPIVTPNTTTTSPPTSSRRQKGSFPHEATQQSNESPFLGFYEIREEYNSSGKEIRAEVVNVAKELEYLEKGNVEAKLSSISSNRSGNWTLEEGNMRQYSVSIPGNVEDSSGEHSETKPTNTDVPNSNDEYAMLSLRLDELARLEEIAEFNDREKALISTKSAKSNLGSGWKKGFLINKPRIAKKQEKETTVCASSANDAGILPPRAKQVKFGRTDVREIPNIGQSNASPVASSSSLGFSRPPPSSTPSAPRQLVSSEVFSGVVTERPVINSASEEPPTTKVSSKTELHKPTKKLSRFAQQRLEQQQRLQNETR